MKYADILPTDVPQTEALDERQVRNNAGAFVLAIDDGTRQGDPGRSAEFAGVRCGAVPARVGRSWPSAGRALVFGDVGDRDETRF